MLKQSDIVMVYGASGTGKTSLIQCGLSKKINDYDWMPFYIRRGSNLNESILNSLEKFAPETEDSASDFLNELFADEPSSTKEESPIVKAIRNVQMNQFKPVYLIFDQFEELFILGTKQEQNDFIQNVKKILSVEQPVKLIFSIREEYLGHLYDFEKAVPQLLRKKIRVEAMHREKVQQIITGVTSYTKSNISISKDETEEFTSKVFEKIKGKKELTIQLPYLQVFLDKLYLNITNDKQRQADAKFTIQELEKLGDIGDVLSEFLEEQVKEIQIKLKDNYKKLELKSLWEILSPFATLEGTKDPLTKTQLYDRLPQTDNNLIDKVILELTNRRILRYSETEDLYELMHDALAQRVAEKRSEDEIALLQARQLIKSQSSLKAEARELFSEKQLALIEPFTDKLKLTQVEKDLIEESHIEAEKLRSAKINRQRKIMVGISVALLVAIVLSVFALVSRSEAKKQEKIASDALIEVEKQTEIANEFIENVRVSTFKQAFLYMDQGEYEVAKQKFIYLRDTIPGGDTSTAIAERIIECEELAEKKHVFDSLVDIARIALKDADYEKAVEFYEKAMKEDIDVGKEKIIIELQEFKADINEKASNYKKDAENTDDQTEKRNWTIKANSLRSLSRRINEMIPE